jgi:hypothetical protein
MKAKSHAAATAPLFEREDPRKSEENAKKEQEKIRYLRVFFAPSRIFAFKEMEPHSCLYFADDLPSTAYENYFR